MPFSLTSAIPAFASPVVAHAFIAVTALNPVISLFLLAPLAAHAVIALAALSSLVPLFLLAPLTYQRLG